mgnify:CR=1 FL=1
MKRIIECTHCGEDHKIPLMTYNMFKFNCKHCHKVITLNNVGKAKAIYWVFFFALMFGWAYIFGGVLQGVNIDRLWVTFGVIFFILFTVVLPLNFIILKYVLPDKIELKS